MCYLPAEKDLHLGATLLFRPDAAPGPVEPSRGRRARRVRRVPRWWHPAFRRAPAARARGLFPKMYEEMSMKPIEFACAVAFAAFVSGAAAAQSPTGISDDVVRIGLLLDMSGPYADITGPGSELAA